MEVWQETDYEGLVHALHELISDIENIKLRIETESKVLSKSKDARQIALNGMQIDISVCCNWINTLINLNHLSKTQYGDNWKPEYLNMIETALRVDESEVSSAIPVIEKHMIDYLRNTLTTKLHFKIENLFKNILKALDCKPPYGFTRISNQMLREAEISSKETEVASKNEALINIFPGLRNIMLAREREATPKDILKVLACMRNSLHTNGIHTEDDLFCSIDGDDFKFHKNKPVTCASWPHIVKIIKANITILESVLFSTRVLNLREEIKDMFAESMYRIPPK
jgi:hypothetical protein